jgi:hypothetical protein
MALRPADSPHIESRASRRALAFDMAYAVAAINRDCVGNEVFGLFEKYCCAIITSYI